MLKKDLVKIEKKSILPGAMNLGFPSVKSWFLSWTFSAQCAFFLLSLSLLDIFVSPLWTFSLVLDAFSGFLLFLFSVSFLKNYISISSASRSSASAPAPLKSPRQRSSVSQKEVDALLSRLRSAVEKDLGTTISDVSYHKKSVPFNSIVFLPLSGKRAFVLPDPHQTDDMSRELDAERTARFLVQNGYAHEKLKPVSPGNFSRFSVSTHWPEASGSLVMEFPSGVFNVN